MSEPALHDRAAVAWNALHESIDLRAVADEQITRATPRTGSTALATVSGAEVGVWLMSAGGMVDVEVDEVFVVVAGEASLTFVSGERQGETIALVPGVVCRLEAGVRTRWDVTELLRKVYVIADADGIRNPRTSGASR